MKARKVKVSVNIIIVLIGVYIFFVYDYAFLAFLFVLPSVIFLYSLTTKNEVIKKTGLKFTDNKDISEEYKSFLQEHGMRKSWAEIFSESSNINMSLIPKFEIWRIKTIRKAMMSLKDILSK